MVGRDLVWSVARARLVIRLAKNSLARNLGEIVMTRRFLAGTLLASLAVVGLWSLANAQNVPGRNSTENVPTPRPRDPSSTPRSAFPKTKNEIEILHALVSSTDPIKLPAREAGSIVEVAVKRGHEVKV